MSPKSKKKTFQFINKLWLVYNIIQIIQLSLIITISYSNYLSYCPFLRFLMFDNWPQFLVFDSNIWYPQLLFQDCLKLISQLSFKPWQHPILFFVSDDYFLFYLHFWCLNICWFFLWVIFYVPFNDLLDIFLSIVRTITPQGHHYYWS